MQGLDALVAAFRRRLPSKLESALQFRATATIYRGLVRGAREPASIIYIGSGTNLSFVLNRFFDEYTDERQLGSCSIWNAARLARANSAIADLSVVDVPWPYEVNYVDDSRILELPAWVRQEFPIDCDWEVVWSRLHRNVRGAQMRKVRKFNLTCKATTDVDAVSQFYDNMYVPHTKRRFGHAAHVESKADVLAAATLGTLLQIFRNGELVAACVLHANQRQLRMPFVGFSADDLRQIDGASAAMYYYSLVHAFENGFRSLDFCGSRPVLDDGVLRQKRGWGAALHDDWALESLLIQFNNQRTGVLSILAGNPVIARQGELLVGKVFYDQQPMGSDMLQRKVHELMNPGLDFLCIYSMHGFDGVRELREESKEVPVRLFDLSGREDPVAAYCDDEIV